MQKIARPKSEYFYVDSIIRDRDSHGRGCNCGICHSSTGIALGASIYLMTPEGLQLYHNSLFKEEYEPFIDWCSNQESQSTEYGPDEKIAVSNTVDQAKEEGWFLLNHPSPLILPLVETLAVLVGEEGSLTSLDFCECHDGLLKNKTMCKTCYARLVYDIVMHHVNASEQIESFPWPKEQG